MGKDSKEKDLNFYYINKKNKVKKDKRAGNNSAPKKNDKKQNQNNKEDELFNFDNEIVIGVTKVSDKQKKETTTKKQLKKGKKVTVSNKNKKTIDKNNKKIVNKKEIAKDKKKSKAFNVIKWIFLISALIGSIVFFMLSPLFNIREIKVTNNNKISTEQILSMSGIELGENTYKINKKQIKDNLRQNAYIESVYISRKLPDVLNIVINERQTNFMIAIGSSYAYINNQGYILEINNEKLNLPIITGTKTAIEDIKEGNRLCIEDLEKLNKVIEIYEIATLNEISNLITEVNITDKENYTLVLETEQKVVYLGDCSDISTRILYLKGILEMNQNEAGEVFINGDLNKRKAFFRKNV